MATRSRTMLMIFLAAVPLIFAARDHYTDGNLAPVASQQWQEAATVALSPGGVGMAALAPAGPTCDELRLYTGPCVDALCVAACVLQLHQGGHCKGGAKLIGHCYCFVCVDA